MGQDPKRGRLITALFLAAFVLPLMTGTTYVVLEGEREVGRYEENDGIQETQYVKNEAPKPAPPVKRWILKPPPRDPLGDQGKRYFDFKIEDPDLIRYLNRQPWMAKLREWDAKYHLEENLGRYQAVFVWAILGLVFLALILRAFRILGWFASKKKRASPADPS